MPPESDKKEITECQEDLTPIWLNQEYMENALRNYKKDNSLKIISIKIQPALGKGENFGGVMTRINLEYICKCNKTEPKTGVYIVKTSFEGDEFALEKMKDYDVFNREMNIYQTILPKLREYMREISDNEILFAETVYIDYKNSAIIFEDLGVKSFTMADRTQGLDKDHIKLALKKMAKMHATSAVLNDRHPGTFKTYDRGFFNHYTNSYAALFVNNLIACGERVRQWNDYKIYGEKIEKLVPHLMDYGRQVFDAEDHHLNSFVHGDFWTNNVMYKYNENNEPTDAVILDFQYSCWGSPTIDLHYFLNTSMREEMRLRDEDELVQHYYYILADTLRALKFKGKIPSLHEFRTQYIEKEFMAFHSSCVIQPIMLNEETEDADFNALMGEDERSYNFKRTIYKNEKVHRNLKKLLPYFDKRGLLDLQS